MTAIGGISSPAATQAGAARRRAMIRMTLGMTVEAR
jgi:hypothetical protein